MLQSLRVEPYSCFRAYGLKTAQTAWCQRGSDAIILGPRSGQSSSPLPSRTFPYDPESDTDNDMNTASRILAAAVSITTPYYIYQVSRQISDVYPSTVTVTNTTSASYLESKSHCTVNPRNCTGLHDTRSIVVELPPTKRAYSDEQILAAYIQGYFGGWVFAPERRALQLLRRRLVNFTGKPTVIRSISRVI